jgi:hypothetical protein
MVRFAYLILIIFFVITGSCSSRKHKLDDKNLIPEKDLISLLVDIHIADGLLVLPKINSWYASLDSISTYYQVIEKHGYTKETMDKTMKYYFINNPKKLNKIYDQVLGILSEMESRIEKVSSMEIARKSNLWMGKEFYSFPGPSVNDSTMFDITLFKPGVYKLTYSVSLFPDDQSINTNASVYSCSPDSIETGKRQYFRSIRYLKDGQPHTYNLIFTVLGQPLRHLRGWLYDFDNPSFAFDKHIQIENISFTFNSVSPS